MRRFPFIVLIAAAVIGCRPQQTQNDTADVQFRSRFDTVELGWSKEKVRELLGDPTDVLTQTEKEDDSVRSPIGRIEVRKGDVTSTWVYQVGGKQFLVALSPARPTSDVSEVVFWKLVIVVGSPEVYQRR